MYYKVVTVYNNRLWSYNVHPSFGNSLSVQYIPNEVTHPIVYETQLFVFQNLKKAKQFANKSLYQTEIWECEIDLDSKRILRKCKSIEWESFLHCSIIKRKNFDVDKFPSGTILTNWVKLIRKVDINEES